MCVAEMGFISGSWNREISQFTQPNLPICFRGLANVSNGHVCFKGQNTTGLMCTRGSFSLPLSLSLSLLHFLSARTNLAYELTPSLQRAKENDGGQGVCADCFEGSVAVCCSVLQCVAVCCSVL